MLTIVTPTLNSAEFIEKNIKSILSLSIPVEHIIVDGGSTDGTLEIITKYKHVKLFHQKESTGMYGAIHQGFLESKGEFISWVNSDDEIIVQGFEKMYYKIKNSKVDLVYSNAFLKYMISGKIVKHKGSKFAKYFIKKGILPFIQPSSIYTKSIYNKVGGLLFEKFRICGDIDLFYRIALISDTKFSYCNCVSSTFLINENSLGFTNSELGFYERKKNKIPTTPFIGIRILYKILKLF